MKKRIIAFSLGATIALGATLLLANEGGFMIFAEPEELHYVHYAKREATSSLPGVREYWAICGQNRYVFTKPVGGHIEEATSYDTSEFLAKDPRYILYRDDKASVFYSLNDEAYDYSEFGSVLYGYQSASPFDKTPGASGRYEFYKDDNSPMYSAPLLTVTDTIAENADLVSFCNAIDGVPAGGYYVMTENLSSPSAYVNNSASENSFSGTFDGRGHSIWNPTVWGKRLFGNIDGATIKNTSFLGISVFCVLGTKVEHTTIENCSFQISSSPNQYSGTAVLADSFLDGVVLRNVDIDMGEVTMKCSWGNLFITAIAGYNQASEAGETVYENVTVRSLNSMKMYVADSYGRSVRPSSINYVSTAPFLKDGVSKYSIRYNGNDSLAEAAASFIQKEFQNATGAALPLSAFSSDSAFSFKDPAIVIGSALSASSNYIDVPTERSAYALKGIGKAIYLNAGTSEGYQLGALKLLNELVGYDYIGADTPIYDLPDKKNIDLPFLDITFIPAIGYRKCDWSDDDDVTGVKSDAYAEGYNAGYGAYPYYLTAPAVGSLSSEMFHTSLRVLYPGTYYSSHSKWYAVDKDGSDYGDNYALWQLCYTAHGDSSEYATMVQTAASYIKNLFASSSNPNVRSFLFGTSDNYNVCQCAACNAAASSYGSVAGTVVKFVNDVRDEIYKDISSTNRDSIDLGLFSYLGYESAPILNGLATISMKDNVFVLVAPIAANYTYALTDSRNAAYATTIENWAKVGSVSAWLYDTNFRHYLFPFNSFKANAENIAYLSNLGVSMLYLQGQHNVISQRTGFNALKKYVHGKIMVDTNYRYEDLVNSFFASYYGEGGAKMRSFFDAMVTKLESIESNSSYTKKLYDDDAYNGNSIYQSINHKEFWNMDELKSWIALCDEAYELASSASAKEHILVESIFPRFAIASEFTAREDWGGKIFSSAWKDDLKAFRLDFKAKADSLGVTLTGENSTSNTLAQCYSDWGIA